MNAARPTLLVVDDDQDNLARLDATFQASYRVLPVGSGAAALAVLGAEDIDLLITDQRMPGMAGLELAAQARRLRPDLPVILLTAYTDPEDLIEAINEGTLYRYVQKPWDARDLAATVHHALEERALRRERDSLQSRMQRRLDALSVLYEVSAEAADFGSYREIGSLITRALHRIVSFDVGASLIVVKGDAPGTVMHLHCETPCDEATLLAVRDRCVELWSALTGGNLGERELVVDVSGERLPPGAAAPAHSGRSTTHIPLVIDGRVVGVIYLVALRDAAFSPDDEKLLYILANQTSAAVRRLATRLLEERQKLRLMVESMADGVIMSSGPAGGETVLVNPAARRMLGLPPEEQLPAITAQDLKERVGYYPFDLVRGNAWDAGEPLREEIRLGDKVLHAIVSPVMDPDGRPVGLVVVLRDITEQKALDHRKGEFVSIVSHELRTPLTSITGALDIVLKSYGGDLTDKQRRYLTLAREACSELSTIVDDLLDATKLERGKVSMAIRPVMWDELGQHACDKFRGAAEEKRITLNFSASRRPIRILGDPERLTQVLNNLLSNALKFTPAGGRVELEVFGPGVAAGQVGISVWNNGDSIPEADRERVFEKFEQVQASSTRRVGGTGLGLSISRSIIEAHGGRIWVEEPGAQGGTTFVATLPVAPPQEAGDGVGMGADPGLPPNYQAGVGMTPPGGLRPAAPATLLATTGKRKILLCDDDRHAAYVIKGTLVGSGHRVRVARDPDEALAIAREDKPDLVVLDLMGGPGDGAASPGMTLLEILKHDPETRHTPVMVVSRTTRRERATAAGADACLDKPLDLAAFQTTAARLLSERGQRRQKILVVDDDPGIRMICREVLETEGFVVRDAADGESALAEAKRFRPDLLLLDVMMPDVDGFQTATRFRADRAAALTPIIFVSARGQTSDKVRAFKLGADDYLVKPFDSAELLARVEKALERKEREVGASPTTRLPGVSAIESEIVRRLGSGEDAAFCYLDLDNLKAFNDYYGYAKADGMIRQIGDIVREVVGREGGAGDFIGHIAGDDFVFITSADRVDRVATTIIESFDRLAPLYYHKADRERGYIETRDRYGVMRRFPIMSVSLAALTARGNNLTSYPELATRAAEAKLQAKGVEGSCYVRDGRVLWSPRERVVSASG